MPRHLGLGLRVSFKSHNIPYGSILGPFLMVNVILQNPTHRSDFSRPLHRADPCPAAPAQRPTCFSDALLNISLHTPTLLATCSE